LKRILIVEDSKMFATMISRKIRFELDFERDVATTLAAAKELIEKKKTEYFLAVLDLHLPDAKEGEIVDYVLSKGIPVIVFTAQFSDEIRERMLSKNVVDYILKEGGPQVVDYLIESIDRFDKNRLSKVMVVDDSRTSRESMRQPLASQQFNVIQAASGAKALELLEKHPDTKVVITDYNMPGMDGFELIARIRQTHPKNKLAIIGVSGYGTGLLSARFLKTGANDFLTKPFLEEELYCRLNQNIEMLDYIETIERTANTDELTGISNRRYFFQLGEKLIENAKRGNIHLTVAMIDVDRLKAVNNAHGYEAGDTVLVEVAQLLGRSFRSADVIARLGGEQFCIAATNMKPDRTKAVFERVRQQVEKKKIRYGDLALSVTVSVGATTELQDSIGDMLKLAEVLLYNAKKNGRNCVVVDN
jgi:diguanylate cyclase (GGDEF)-like protein